MDYHNIKNWKFPEVDQTYTENDSILYALGIGFGQEPTNPQQLKYVYEKKYADVSNHGCGLGLPRFLDERSKSRRKLGQAGTW
jgi:hypothetical protein